MEGKKRDGRKKGKAGKEGEKEGKDGKKENGAARQNYIKCSVQ